MMLVALTLILSLTGAGAGFTVGTLLNAASDALPVKATEGVASNAPHEGDHTGKGNAAAVHADSAPSASSDDLPQDLDLNVVPFPPVLTTLAAPPGRWIRLEGSALIMKQTEISKDVLAEKAAEQILTYLRTVNMDQIEGPSGFLGLREDINEMVRVLSDDQVRGILIHGVVVE